MRAVQLTLVVPCYNEAERLDLEAFRTFDAGSDQVGFLFVDDGSRDGTRRLLQSNGFDVLGLDRNVGKAEAVRRGIVAAMERGAEIVGFWDADLATPLSELPLFLEILKARPAIEMVYGARVRLLGRHISRHESRHYFGRIGATLISKTLGLAVYDTQCGAKLFRASDTMRDVFAKPFLSRWIFDVEIIARFVRLRGRDGAARAIYELPLRVWKDVTGSKLRSTDFARALRDLWRIRRAYKR
jgi:glycosyltransferase involved in cell wall biosynthesis